MKDEKPEEPSVLPGADDLDGHGDLRRYLASDPPSRLKGSRYRRNRKPKTAPRLTDFQQKVIDFWTAYQDENEDEIPTYAEVAEMLGSTPRSVGYAISIVKKQDLWPDECWTKMEPRGPNPKPRRPRSEIRLPAVLALKELGRRGWKPTWREVGEAIGRGADDVKMALQGIRSKKALPGVIVDEDGRFVAMEDVGD